MSRTALALYLDGPLQSWGFQSRFDRRTTLAYPTRSGILGLLCAALGIDRRDDDGLKRLEPLELTVYTFTSGERLIDFHTVGGGYDKKIQRKNIVATAEGKVGNTVITYREYLQGARFGVIVEGERPLLDELAAALADPRWGVWLGRKSCIPSAPIDQGIHDNAARALEHLTKIAGKEPTRQVRPARDREDSTYTLMDNPLSFGERRFAPRLVADEPMRHEGDVSNERGDSDE